MPATRRPAAGAAASSSSKGKGKGKGKKPPSQEQATPKTQAEGPSTTHPLPRDAILYILGFLGTARDTARCTTLSKEWRESANDVGIWRRILELERPTLAATVLPLLTHRLPASGGSGMEKGNMGRLHPWHPKRLLKKHWRVQRDRGAAADDSDDEEEEEEDSDEEGGGGGGSWAKRQRKEEQRWRARFRDCYLQLTLTDGDAPAGRPVATKLFPLSNKAVVTGLFTSAAGKDSLCLGPVPATADGQGKGKGGGALRLLPRRVEATLSVLDLSGEEPKAAFLLSGSRYKPDRYEPGLLRPDGGRDAFKPNTAGGGMMGDFGYFHQLELAVDDAAAGGGCQQAAAVATGVGGAGRAALVHFGVQVLLFQCDEAEEVEMDAVESWTWMDGTWSKLAWK